MGINKEYSHWTKLFDPDYLKGMYLNWTGLIHNSACVKGARILVKRLVKGAFSDHTKEVMVGVPKSQVLEGSILLLECNDKLPYTIQVELLEHIRVNGKLRVFSEKSPEFEVLLL